VAAVHVQDPHPAEQGLPSLARFEQAIAQHAAQHVQRARQRCAGNHALGAAAPRHGDAQIGLADDLARRTDALQERQRVNVAAHHRVLAVVDRLAGRAIGERIRAPAEMRARLEEQGPQIARGELDGGGQSGEAAADYDHGRHGCSPANCARPQAVSASVIFS
jgi:hypothetical protein